MFDIRREQQTSTSKTVAENAVEIAQRLILQKIYECNTTEEHKPTEASGQKLRRQLTTDMSLGIIFRFASSLIGHLRNSTVFSVRIFALKSDVNS
ncbi:hypothetical protein RUM43_005448 [Polyplax serrata]|uniref:Uncharacterized protein n=1 Tax=Polyplax serrata TaxID=468196 RepID=A0AAN8NQ75_POLSC